MLLVAFFIMKYYYPVIFIPDGNQFTAIAPDINRENGGISTQGDTLTHATYWILDAIGTWFDDGNNAVNETALPAPSKISDLDLSDFPANVIVNIVEFDPELWKSTVNPIRRARENAGISVKELANLLGAPYRTVQDWNSGVRKPPAWLQKIIIEKILAAI